MTHCRRAVEIQEAGRTGPEPPAPDAHHAEGDPIAAHGAWHQALRIYSQLGHPDAEELREKIGRELGRSNAASDLLA